ncbi:MAG: S1C family serine protease [Candidatus Nanohaloarchaea archaeon]
MEDRYRAAALLLTVAVAGGLFGASVVHYSMSERVEGLESQVETIQDQQQNIYVNDTGVAYESIFNRTGDSVVYINTNGSQGSGFVYSENGYIVTNQHVVKESSRIEVSFTDGETLKAEIVGEDPYTDLAVLKVERSGLKPLKLSDSEKASVGQTAIAIGNPFGLESSMTQGIISQTGRSITVEGGFSIRNVIQTDAAINPGNSGGPLLNRKGDVVGVNTAIETQSGGFQGVGFTIPSNTVERVVPEIIDTGEYEHPWIGVRGRDVTPDIAENMDLNNSTGFLVLEVVEDSPAEEAGLQPSTDTVETENGEILVGGDIIIGIEGRKVRGIEDVLEHLALRTNVGDEISLEVLRNGTRKELDLRLQSRP